RTLFLSVAAIQLGPDAHMKGVAGELTNMVYVLYHLAQADPHIRGGGFSPDPIRDHHPGIQCYAYYSLSADQFHNLLIGELPVVVHKFPTVVVACPYRAMIYFHGIPKTLIA